MVSEKLVIALITIAIILSLVSVVVTISSINSKMIPEINAKPQVIPDNANAQLGIVITPPVDRGSS
jgi:hypothetical protein